MPYVTIYHAKQYSRVAEFYYTNIFSKVLVSWSKMAI
jgi:hypothetical protein